MVNVQDLFGDAKCYQTIREMRWPDGVICPHCPSGSIIKNGRDDTGPHRRRDECKGCHRRFDDLTDTSFAGHHQPPRARIACLYLTGLDLSGSQIAQESDINKDDARARVSQPRQGIVERRPPVALEGQAECDEVYAAAGHKGHPEGVGKKGGPPPETPEGGARAGGASQGEAADLRDVAARWRGRDPDAGERPAGDDRPAGQGLGLRR
jgi:transposase-like protein